MTTPPPLLVERLLAWADAGDMGRKPDPTDLRRQAATALEALAAERDALLDLVKGAADIFEHCSVEMGCCCCGDSVETHSIGSGHSPVDQGAYAVGRWQEQARTTLNGAPQP